MKLNFAAKRQEKPNCGLPRPVPTQVWIENHGITGRHKILLQVKEEMNTIRTIAWSSNFSGPKAFCKPKEHCPELKGETK